ncbi:BLUF domain-containing protein [Pseudoalteromonas sp. S16_S37]|uniref:BLUF domain-containing protein n=1 Tax=Pseudoalteromonas sp. S16_S37 TaxID=2720228 RepID=UPI0016805EFA|nr:BLUF domain-containing protein [Pseudoalteromonas sp. S16_S37]MBD1581056.1 BLUF domain-containing protein [Pseudoalteromonas sp. S16_S37]
MFLTRLIYASTIGDNFSQHTIEDILESARHNNLRHNITGVLCFNCSYFLQCLEGARTEVNETYKRILNDERHQNVVMLDYREIDSREFSDWTMGYIPSSTISIPINLKFSEASEFNPYAMSGASAYMMLLELKRSVPTL